MAGWDEEPTVSTPMFGQPPYADYGDIASAAHRQDEAPADPTPDRWTGPVDITVRGCTMHDRWGSLVFDSGLAYIAHAARAYTTPYGVSFVPMEPTNPPGTVMFLPWHRILNIAFLDADRQE